MRVILPCSIIIFACLYIFVIPSQPESISLLFKVIPMILIIVYARINRPSNSNKTYTLILIGLLFSTIGDATLRWFVIGLTAFLIGHLFYIAAFRRLASFSIKKSVSLVLLIPYGLWIGMELVRSLTSQNEALLIAPVIAYIIVILLMSFMAISTGNFYAIIGSLLFVISDSILAWNMFIQSVSFADISIMTTYYGAQFFIALAIKTIGHK